MSATTSVPAGSTDTTGGGEVARLRGYFATGATRSQEWRIAQLTALETLLTEQETAILAAIAADLGRTGFDAYSTEIGPTLTEVRYAKKHLATWRKVHKVSLPLSMRPGAATYRYEPLGVVLVIGPWNYPAYLTLAPLVAALAAGNCAVVKPSEMAPATAAVLADLLPRYLDTRAVEVVTGGPEETQTLLAQGFDYCFFTGSPGVGALIMAGAAPTLTPVTLELGGKSPVIVAADADVEVAARRIAWTKLINSGQTCIAPDYVLADRSIRDDLVAAILRHAETMQAGRTALPILNSRQAGRLAGLLREAHGGRVAAGGVVDTEAHTASFTVVDDPDVTSKVMTEEIFGPILPVVAVDGVEEAMAFVAARPKPLACYVFTSSAELQERAVEEIAAGAVVVNHLMVHVLVPQLPFGGVGHSGMGAYHGQWGFETFSHRKSAIIKRTRPDPSLAYPPYTPLKEKLLRRLM